MAPRADAVRNRSKILSAARDQIIRYGPDAGMDEIAAAAGVAVGTLYRHFPTKTDLVSAVLSESLGQVANAIEAAVERAKAGAQAMGELSALIGDILDASATDAAVKAAARSLGADPDGQGEERRAAAALADLIETAQQEGDLHPDVTVGDFYLLISNAPADQPADVRARWLTLVLPGLTTRGRT